MSGKRIIIMIIEAPKELTLEYEGMCLLKDFARLVHDWLMERGYQDLAGREDKYLESFYFEKITQKGKDIYMWWRTKRPGQHKYIEYNINLDFDIKEVKDLEIVYKGQKLKANSGKIKLFIRGRVIFDEKGELEKSFFGKLFWKSFITRHYKKDLDQATRELESDCTELMTYIKQYLEMKGFMQRVETFMPAKGLI